MEAKGFNLCVERGAHRAATIDVAAEGHVTGVEDRESVEQEAVSLLFNQAPNREDASGNALQAIGMATGEDGAVVHDLDWRVRPVIWGHVAKWCAGSCGEKRA